MHQKGKRTAGEAVVFDNNSEGAEEMLEGSYSLVVDL